MEVNPFTIQVPDEVLNDLSRRLENVRWPDEIPQSDWNYGCNLDYLKELVDYWRPPWGNGLRPRSCLNLATRKAGNSYPWRSFSTWCW